jgi:hypothetical protein
VNFLGYRELSSANDRATVMTKKSIKTCVSRPNAGTGGS